MKLNSVRKYWLPVIVWIGFVFWISTGSGSPEHTSSILEPLLRFFYPSITEGEIEIVHAVARKLAHVVEFFIGGLLFFKGVSKRICSTTGMALGDSGSNVGCPRWSDG